MKSRGAMPRFIEKIESARPFTDREAWGLFRLAAFGEAVGWTLLIGGLLVRHFRLPGHKLAVPIAGQFHGVLFIIYFALLFAVYSSLRWPRRRFVLALIAGVLPYGTLIFEQWVAYVRRNESSRGFLSSTVVAAITT